MKITEIVAWVSTAAFLLSVAHIYGFSHSIEVNLISYFSTNDYIKHSVCWLPMTTLAFGIGVLYAKMQPTLFGSGSSFEDKIAKYPNMSAFCKFMFKHEDTILFKIIPGYVIGSTLFNVFRFAPEHALHICYCLIGIGLWIAFFCYYLKPSLDKEKEWTIRKQKALLLGPMLIVVVYIHGILSGLSDIQGVEKHPKEILEITSEETNKKGRVLFALSQYVVFLEQKTKKIEIIPVGQVKDIIPIPEDKGKEKKNKKQLDEAKKK